MLLQVQEEFTPTLLALAVAIEHCNQLLRAIGRGSHQHKNALFLVGIVFQPNFDVDAIGPDVNVLFLGKVTPAPLDVLFGPLLLESDDHVGAEAFSLLANQSLQGFSKIIGGNSFEVEPRDQLFDRLGSTKVSRQHTGRELHTIGRVWRVVANASLLDLDGSCAVENLPRWQASILDHQASIIRIAAILVRFDEGIDFRINSCLQQPSSSFMDDSHQRGLRPAKADRKARTSGSSESVAGMFC